MLKFNGVEKAYSNFADCTIFVEVGRKYQLGLWKAQYSCKNNGSLQKEVSNKLRYLIQLALWGSRNLGLALTLTQNKVSHWCLLFYLHSHHYWPLS